jgi:hypothetical protein
MSTRRRAGLQSDSAADADSHPIAMVAVLSVVLFDPAALILLHGIGRGSTLPNRHALLGQLLLRMLVLGEMRQTHATQHIGSLSELDVVIADDLDAVAPGVAKV